MGRLVLASTLAMMAAHVAYAGPKRAVEVETEPDGATVYLDEIEGQTCKTPCRLDPTIGKHTLIMRLDNYDPDFVQLDVQKGRGAQRVTYKFKSALGSIVVDGPKGATVKVDAKVIGEAPTRTSVTSTEGHHVEIKVGGKTIYDDFVNVAAGDQEVIKAPTGRPATAVAETDPVDAGDEVADPDDPEPTGGGGGVKRSSEQVSQPAPAAPQPWILAAFAVDAGIRTFRYDTPDDPNTLRKADEQGQWIAGPAVEWWPGRMLHIGELRGLSLFGRAQFINLVNHLVVNVMPDTKTEWASYEASLRWRLSYKDFGIEPSVGYVQDSFKYDRDPNAVLPAAEYQSLRMGVKLSYDWGRFEPYGALENRIAMGGTVARDFTDVKTSGGFRGAIGFFLDIVPWLSVRAEGSAMSYSWTFGSTSGMNHAQGASDSIMSLSLLAAVTH